MKEQVREATVSSQQSEMPTVKKIDGTPDPDPQDSARLECTNRLAVLGFWAASSSGGGEIEIRFKGVSTLSFGWPNDEALHGHRLWGRGLQHYAIQEVHGSDWIEELERRNAVHRRHRPGAYRSKRHIIITFKEDTFECVCDEMELTHRRARSG
jgi:hypothetical protein